MPIHEMPWIKVCKNAPYFETEDQESWTPIGQNDAVTWPDFQMLFRRKDPVSVANHMKFLAAHGVTCIRIMMEYCQTEHRYFENPVGRFQPNMIQFWDDLFVLCKQYNIRLLITPFDTFWMKKRWKYHPYNKLNGGPCKTKTQWLASPEMVTAIKERFTFFITRWGRSGVLFAWDLWNEIDPVHSGKDLEKLNNYIVQISAHIRELEMQLYQKTHLQTVSVFAPILEKHSLEELVFSHPLLDFASIHLYEKQTIDYPGNAINPAIATGNLVKQILRTIPGNRPFLDSEHGPISYFKRYKKGLDEAFDNTYFLYMQWAHLASGGAGGGMRWPYRHPHVLTHGMRKAQQNMAGFTKLIEWQNFQRTNCSDSIAIKGAATHVFACGDKNQALIWLLRTSTLKRRKKNEDQETILTIPGLDPGVYNIIFWDTEIGIVNKIKMNKSSRDLEFKLEFKTNQAIAIKKEMPDCSKN